ncbi:putative phosphatase-domain-containing protein [Haematococcus lacustris]
MLMMLRRLSLRAASSTAGCKSVRSLGMAQHHHTKTLVVFDFDHTVVDDNSDTFIYRALPGGVLPGSVKALCRPGEWTAFMQEVLLHAAQQGVGPQELRHVLQQIPWTPGMKELLHYLGQHPELYECIIVSDANSCFIDWILQPSGQASTFSAIYTNPAQEEQAAVGSQASPSNSSSSSSRAATGWLRVSPHHSHACPTCSANLCKRAVVAQHSKAAVGRLQVPVQPAMLSAVEGVGAGQQVVVEEGQPAASARAQGPWTRVVYVGDGRNDLCPALALGPGDVVFPRRDFALHGLLNSLPTLPDDTTANYQAQGPGAGHNVGPGVEESLESASGAGQGGGPGAGVGCVAQPAGVMVGKEVRSGMGQGGEAGAGGQASSAGARVVAQVVAWESGWEVLAWLQAHEAPRPCTQHEGAAPVMCAD